MAGLDRTQNSSEERSDILWGADVLLYNGGSGSRNYEKYWLYR